jgi:hypothetical protein
MGILFKEFFGNSHRENLFALFHNGKRESSRNHYMRWERKNTTPRYGLEETLRISIASESPTCCPEYVLGAHSREK